MKIEPDIKKIIEGNPLALATVDSTGKPNVIGVAFVKVVSDNQVLITDNFMKQTKENLMANKSVCLATWNKDRDGYKLVGEAEYIIEGRWKKYVEDIPDNKNLSAKGAILVTISKLIPLK